MSIDQLRGRLDRGEAVVFLDARGEQAYSSSDQTIPGSIRVAPDRVGVMAGVVPRTGAPIVAWCT